MNKLFDLRFVIGSFFALIGLLLLGHSFMGTIKNSETVNRWCGLVFIVFGILMIFFSFVKNADDELLEDD